jgi:hypothetical protein
MQASQKTSRFQENLALKKKLVEGRCVREVTQEFGPWFFFGTTYSGEINIFGLSKDQTFRI